jgi:hypothetical protein
MKAIEEFRGLLWSSMRHAATPTTRVLAKLDAAHFIHE